MNPVMNDTFLFVNNKEFMAGRRRREHFVRMAKGRSRLGSGLRKRGNELGLSQAAIARACGLSPERYGQYVRGEREPDFETLDTICRVLHTTPDRLLGYADAEPEGLTEAWSLIPAESRERAILTLIAAFADPTRTQDWRARIGAVLDTAAPEPPASAAPSKRPKALPQRPKPPAKKA